MGYFSLLIQDVSGYLPSAADTGEDPQQEVGDGEEASLITNQTNATRVEPTNLAGSVRSVCHTVQ